MWATFLYSDDESDNIPEQYKKYNFIYVFYVTEWANDDYKPSELPKKYFEAFNKYLKEKNKKPIAIMTGIDGYNDYCKQLNYKYDEKNNIAYEDIHK